MESTTRAEMCRNGVPTGTGANITASRRSATQALDRAQGFSAADRLTRERAHDRLDERESDRLWGEEAERRLAAFRTGTADARPAEDVYARAERPLSD